MVSCGQIQFMCLEHHVSALIADKIEFSTQNKMERAITGEMIKETCVPIKVDRLGNIKELDGRRL